MELARRSAVPGVLPEGPLWDHRSDTLYWVDIDQGLLWCARDGQSPTVLYRDSAYISGVWLAHDGGLVVSGERGIRRVSLEGHDLGAIAGVPALDPRLRFNDGAVDPGGRLLIGTMGRTESDFIQPLGNLFRLDASGTCDVLITGLTISNGIGWSPEGDRAYVADTIRRRLLVIPYPPAAMSLAADACDAIALDVLPDGLTVRSDGTLVVAAITARCLLLLSPWGEVIDRILLPTSCPTSCCFGGKALDRLFVTTSTHLLDAVHGEEEAGFVLELTGMGRGLPEFEFGRTG